MEIGLRILALIIDGVLCVAVYPLVCVSTSRVLESPGVLGLVLLPLWFAVVVLWPFVYWGVPTGLWGRTPGRWICRLKVTIDGDHPPGLWRGLGRETLKLLAVASSIGALICFLQLVFQHTTWYDQLCGTIVTFKPWVRLTRTQRQFRKTYKPPRL